MVLPLIAAAFSAARIRKIVTSVGTIVKNAKRLEMTSLKFRAVTSERTSLQALPTFNTPSKAAQLAANKKRLRELASSLSAKANKRAQRLEASGFTDQSAYKRYIDGGGKFVVKGKSDKEVLAEIKRVKEFLNDQTSTVTGINKQAASVAKRLNIKYKTYKELREKNEAIFKILPKITEYMKMSNKTHLQYDSDQVIDEVTDYVDEMINNLADGEKIDVSKAILDIEDRIAKLDEKATKVKRNTKPSFFRK